jgi:hypothetical protein
MSHVEEERDCCLTPNEQFFIYIMSRTAWVRARFCKLQKRVHSTGSDEVAPATSFFTTDRDGAVKLRMGTKEYQAEKPITQKRVHSTCSRK